MREGLDYAVLSSGSIGNSYAIHDGSYVVLIDCGLTLKQLELRLENELGATLDMVVCVFLTHLHPDHAKCARRLAYEYNVPIYMNIQAAREDEREFLKCNIPEDKIHFFETGRPFSAYEYDVEAFDLSHDAPGTVGYKIKDKDYGFVFTVITDTGCTNPDAIRCASEADVLFLEANYDEEMLENGPYPRFLKKRIASRYGHLSNNDAATFLNSCRDKLTRVVYLIHPSDNNNTTEKMCEAFKNVSHTKYSSIVALGRGESYSDSINPD